MPLKKIDFNANAEFKYLANWKVIQTHFNKHKIDKVIPVERLAKCKMQDNLEFLQWSKKYWDQMFPGGDYNASARRGGQSSGSNLNTSTSLHHAAPSTSLVVWSTAPSCDLRKNERGGETCQVVTGPWKMYGNRTPVAAIDLSSDQSLQVRAK